MPRIIVTTRAGQVCAIEARDGRSAMEAITDAGIGELLAFCGGWGVCATCQVYVDPEFAALLEPAGDIEREMLRESRHCTEQSRLSCQIIMTDALDGLRLTVAPEEGR